MNPGPWKRPGPGGGVGGLYRKRLEDIREVIVAMGGTGVLTVEGGVVTDSHRDAAWDFFCRQTLQ